MFRGATFVNLDSKSRLAVLTHQQEKLNEESASLMVCTIHPHKPCLFLYPFRLKKSSKESCRDSRA